MKYRVRLDMSFESETDATALMTYAKKISLKAVSINEGLANAEMSFMESHLCGHDEGLPCGELERIEIKTLPVSIIG